MFGILGIQCAGNKSFYLARVVGISFQMINRRYGGFLTVFVFAVTPLPDDLLYIPLGMIKYPFRKTLLACFIGKTLFMTGLAYFGRMYLLGLSSFIPGEDQLNQMSLSLIFSSILIACYLLIRINWIAIFERFTFYKKSTMASD